MSIRETNDGGRNLSRLNIVLICIAVLCSPMTQTEAVSQTLGAPPLGIGVTPPALTSTLHIFDPANSVILFSHTSPTAEDSRWGIVNMGNQPFSLLSAMANPRMIGGYYTPGNPNIAQQSILPPSVTNGDVAFSVGAPNSDLLFAITSHNGAIRMSTTPSSGIETERMTILDNGNVGIGDIAPATKLSVAGIPNQARFPNVDRSYGALIETYDDLADGTNDSYGGIALSSFPGQDYTIGKRTLNAARTYFQIRRQDDKELMTITKDGFVGIGMKIKAATMDNDPKSLLHLYAPSPDWGQTLLRLEGCAMPTIDFGSPDAGTDNDPNSFGCRLRNRGRSILALSWTDQNEQNPEYNALGEYLELNNQAEKGANWDRILLSHDKGILFSTDNTEKVRIASVTGNVGIGEKSPQQKLHVSGNIILGTTTGSAPSVLSMYPGSSTGSQWNFASIQNGGKLILTEGNYSNGITPSENTNWGIPVLTVLHSSGNVGIGVSNPQQKLVVDGTICAKEIRVSLGGSPCWSDFVFADTFKLRPLNELEQYVTINKHLPDIPSAQEVEQNGVHIGEMQSRLLQKVEELTLYVIDLKKDNVRLASELERLQQQVQKEAEK